MTLTQRVSKLEKKAASQIRTCPSGGLSVYQPSDADLAYAVAILVKCGVVRIINGESTDITRR